MKDKCWNRGGGGGRRGREEEEGAHTLLKGNLIHKHLQNELNPKP